MKLARSILADLKRVMVSPAFCSAVLLAAAVIFFSISQETDGWGDGYSVYYLLNVRYGISAFLPAMAVSAVLPFGLSYREDRKNGYLNCILSREPAWVYCWSKVIVVWLTAVLVVFLGYLLAFGILSIKYPFLRTEDLEALAQVDNYSLYESLVFSRIPWLYLVCVCLTEAFGFGFMTVLTLTVSTKVKSPFLLLCVPLLFYELTVLALEWLKLPFIMNWISTMKDGGVFQVIAPDIGICMLEVFGYFLTLSIFLGIVFTRVVTGRKGGGNS